MGTVLRLLKSNITKYIFMATMASGVGLYLYNTIQENGRLEEKLQNTEAELANAQLTLEVERKRFKRTIENYDNLMSEYMDQIQTNQQESQRLRRYLSNVEDANIQTCLDTTVDENFLNNVFNREAE